MGGDFNDFLYSSDRKGSYRMNAHSERFYNWVSDFSLIDIPLTNLRQKFVSKDWQDLNPKVLSQRPSRTSFQSLPAVSSHGMSTRRSNTLDSETCCSNINVSKQLSLHGGMKLKFKAGQRTRFSKSFKSKRNNNI